MKELSNPFLPINLIYTVLILCPQRSYFIFGQFLNAFYFIDLASDYTICRSLVLLHGTKNYTLFPEN